MRCPLRVAVPHVEVMDCTRQRVQLLQRYRKSHSHVSGDQIPAGNAVTTTKLCYKRDSAGNKLSSYKAVFISSQ